MRSAGITEPAFGLYRTNEDGERGINEEIANSYGSALSVLYHFRSDKFILLHTPTLGDLRKIDLKKIAEKPSAAYLQAILDYGEGV